MFDGISDQFHQFIASRASLPISLSFPLHGSAPNFTSFDPYPSHQTLQPHLPQQLHCQSHTSKDEGKGGSTLVSRNLEVDRETSMPERIDPWSNEEVLALLRVRSSMEHWFPDFTWEHVSRKLGELGFKRSAEKCKEKFEEENRLLTNINYSKNYRCFSELEEVYHCDSTRMQAENNQSTEKPNQEEDKIRRNVEENSRNETPENPPRENEEVEKSTKGKKRKRKQKLEMFKSFCVDIVNKMMAQQEELHNKLLEDMVKRDADKTAREEVWKKQEMERINREIELRTREQAIAGDRQATIIEFLKKFTSGSENQSLKVPNSSSSMTSSSLKGQSFNSTLQLTSHNKVEAATSSNVVGGYLNPSSLSSQNSQEKSTIFSEILAPLASQNPSSALATDVPSPSIPGLSLQNPNSTNTESNPLKNTSSSVHKAPENAHSELSEKGDISRRWPRNEVLALINLRSSLNKNDEDKEGAKVPLWERISQGMFELGYRRTAKRCKEKWENINKYFRKTKDVNKKRSLDSRTCPYFHQLSCLYSQGTLMGPACRPENRSTSPTKPQG